MTARFDHLHSRTISLRDRYLPEKPNEIGDYSEEQQDDARACILLVHAEAESYLEGLADELCTRVGELIANERYDSMTSSFLYFYGARTNEMKDAKSLEDVAKGAVALHGRVLHGNNGIKSKDISKMFDPFFVGGIDLDASLEQVLDSFGSLRGKCAHSSFIGISEEINCYEIREQMNCLLSHLRRFDSRFNDYAL